MATVDRIKFLSRQLLLNDYRKLSRRDRRHLLRYAKSQRSSDYARLAKRLATKPSTGPLG
jgi:hypothetical protein